MKRSDLQFDYPEDLVATEPKRPSRVLWNENNHSQEIQWKDFLSKIPAGDVLVVNNTRVLKRRVFAGEIEILFLNQTAENEWDVLFPSKNLKIGDQIELPMGKKIELIQKGRPQKVRALAKLDESYFQQVAELPLPPYIQKARGLRRNVLTDQSWYQTAWADKPGSLAAPTASLHFSAGDIVNLIHRGVKVVEITLHVGLGTFLPVTAEDLDQHEMHAEYVQIPKHTWDDLVEAKAQGKKVWALGTTVTRSLESAATDLLPKNENGYAGFTKLLIQPGFQFQIVDRLLTNFHQPESTLLALVAAFSNLQIVKQAYTVAIEKKFRLFSYGDLSVWIK
jgi:S-adenosylmethionine:tRNA ribosyltransferase-isomerase